MRLISFDLETWGFKDGYMLQPWRSKTNEGGIICCSSFDGKSLYNTDISNPVWKTENVLLCGWNLKFDVAWLLAEGYRHLINMKYIDGMLLLKRIMPNLLKYGLKPTLEKFKDEIKFRKEFPFVSGYSDDIEFKVGYPYDAYTQEERYKLEKYCNQDAVYTWFLVGYLMSIASEEDIKQCIKESTVSVLFADIWVKGIPLDAEEILKQHSEIESKLEEYSETLSKIGLTSSVIKSPMQLRNFIQKEWKLKLTKLTPKGQPSVDMEVLKNLYFESTGNIKTIIELLLKFKELQTEKDKFIISAIKCLDEGNTIHPDVFMNSTYTGRLTYAAKQNIKSEKVFKNGKTRKVNKEITIGLPLHQMKRGNIRKIIKAPAGFTLVELDFAAQELRLMADIANERTMIDFFNSNKDLHAYTAASIYGFKYEDFQKLKKDNPNKYKEMRQLGKITNLSLQYRLSAPNLYRVWHTKYGLTDKTIQDAEQARLVYLNIYSGISRYWKETVVCARNKGFIENKSGRKYPLDNWTDEEWKSSQTAINFPIQSTGADQKILALYYLRPFLLENNIQLAWDLHDGMFFFVPNRIGTKELVGEMVKIASNLPYDKAWGWNPKVKFPVEAKIGSNWGELKSI